MILLAIIADDSSEKAKEATEDIDLADIVVSDDFDLNARVKTFK